jgi:hypothetical protein
MCAYVCLDLDKMQGFSHHRVISFNFEYSSPVTQEEFRFASKDLDTGLEKNIFHYPANHLKMKGSNSAFAGATLQAILHSTIQN